MATNQFKSFAAGGGANVVTQATWEALATLLANGFGSGLAQSNQANKAWRQTSAPVSQLMQMVSDVLNENVNDDGNLTLLEQQLFRSILNGIVMLDVGLTANTLIFNPGVLLTTLGPRASFIGRVANTNTSRTVSAVISGGTPLPIFDDDGNQVQVGVLQAGRFYLFNSDGVGLRVANTAIIANIVGPTVRVSAVLGTAGPSATFTADYVSVATVLGGQTYTLSGFNQTLNLGTTGAGGMDIGLAPISGFVSIYAIYNPATRTRALLATTATQTTVYNGVNMPAGYTASGLLAIWPTDGSRNLQAGNWFDRRFSYAFVAYAAGNQVLSLGAATTITSIALGALVPAAARFYQAEGAVEETGAASGSSFATFYAQQISSTQGGGGLVISSVAGGGVFNNGLVDLPLPVPQTTYYLAGSASVKADLFITGYEI